MAHTALVVVDMQNGFFNDNTRHILPFVQRLVGDDRWDVLAFTRFVNRPDSGYVRWMGWSRFMAPPEIDIIDPLRPLARDVFDKCGYSAFTPEFCRFISERETQKLVLCGVATDGCVLKTAIDAFERGIEPVVVVDACASHAGPEIHEAGLTLLRRFVGGRQLRTTAEVLGLDDKEPK